MNKHLGVCEKFEELKKVIVNGDTEVLICSTENGKYLFLKGVNGNTLLHIAALCGSKEVCSVLLDRLVKKIRSFKENTKELERIASRLRNKQGKSPAHLAAEADNVKFYEALFESEVADFILNIRDNFGNLPVHTAAASGSLNVLRLFLTQKEEKNNEGNTPLHLAVMNNRVEAVEFIVKAGASLRVRNDYGLTPVALAKLHGYSRVLEVLENFCVSLGKR